MAKPKRYGEVAVKNRARQHSEITTASMITLAAGDTAWNPFGDDFADVPRVIYQFDADGTPLGTMVITEVPDFI